jgi:hypothetical protein
MKWARHAARIRRKWMYIDFLTEKSEGKKPLGRRRCRRADNVRMDLREIEWGGMDCIYLALNRDQWRALVNMIMKLRAGPPIRGGGNPQQISGGPGLWGAPWKNGLLFICIYLNTFNYLIHFCQCSIDLLLACKIY